MSNAPIVIVLAPQGAGKSQHAARLAKRFGCTQVVDDWDGRTPLQPGSLALASISVAQAAGKRASK